LMLVAPLVLTGCHDREKLRERLEGPAPARLPVEPDQPESLPTPALLDTVEPWRQPPLFGPRQITAWLVVTLKATDQYDITYRVPDSWEIDDARAKNASGEIKSKLQRTTLDSEKMPLAAYASQLADGSPIYQYTSDDGHIVYVTRRGVAIAPSDPNTPRGFFHTAVTEVDGDIYKLDVRYSSTLKWRYSELADGIVGTVQVREHEAAAASE
jgi:hypothetical protein